MWDFSHFYSILLANQITVGNETNMYIGVRCSNIKFCKHLVSNYKWTNFYPLGVVGRGSEAQLQVGGNLNLAL